MKFCTSFKPLATSVSLILSLFVVGFVILSPDFKDYATGWRFMGLGVICFLMIVYWDKIPKKRPERRMFSFDKNWFMDLIVGIVIGIGILFLMGQLTFFSILVPDAPQSISHAPLSIAGSFISVNIIAPLIEETAFRILLFGLFWTVIGWGLWTSVIFSNIGFSAYHIWSYAGDFSVGAISAVQSAFISAVIMGIVFSILMLWKKSVSASMGAHATINTGLTAGRLIVVGL